MFIKRANSSWAIKTNIPIITISKPNIVLGRNPKWNTPMKIPKSIVKKPVILANTIFINSQRLNMNYLLLYIKCVELFVMLAIEKQHLFW